MATDVQLVRTLIPDTEAVFGPTEDQTMFADSDIENFITLGKGNLLRAAGLAMIAVGNSEALILKIIKTQDLSTNGAELQNQWRQAGKLMLDRADKEDETADAEYFQIIDYGWGSYPPELTEPEWTWR